MGSIINGSIRYRSIWINSSLDIPFQTATFERISFEGPGRDLIMQGNSYGMLSGGCAAFELGMAALLPDKMVSSF